MRHYLDHASTSPARPEVVEAMVPWLANAADPGRVHTEGKVARGAVESARETVAALLGARAREVVFTSGGTEAINAAVWGAAERGSHIVCPAVEHSAVRDAAAQHDVTWVGVDHLGRVDADELLEAVRANTALVNLQWANHEVATLQPIAAVVAECRERGVLVQVSCRSPAVSRLRLTLLGPRPHASSRTCPPASSPTATPACASPTSSASASKASRPRPCSSVSTRRASPPTREARARQNRSS